MIDIFKQMCDDNKCVSGLFFMDAEGVRLKIWSVFKIKHPVSFNGQKSEPQNLTFELYLKTYLDIWFPFRPFCQKVF